MTSKPITLAPATVDPRILRVRGIQVLVDADLAEIYGVSTKARTTKTLISTARWLFNTDAAMIDPCSVNAHGSTGENLSRVRWIDRGRSQRDRLRSHDSPPQVALLVLVGVSA